MYLLHRITYKIKTNVKREYNIKIKQSSGIDNRTGGFAFSCFYHSLCPYDRLQNAIGTLKSGEKNV